MLAKKEQPARGSRLFQGEPVRGDDAGSGGACGGM